MAKEKKSVQLYYEYIDTLEDLDDKQFRDIIKCMVEYDKSDIIIPLDKISKMAFNFIKQRIDYDKSNYKEKCDKNKEIIQNYWNKQKNTNKKNNTNEYERIGMNTNATDIDIDIELDIDIDKELDINNNINNNTNNNKPKKSKYGEYKNVLLTEEELQSLKSSYDNTDALIKYLDEYIEMKGYKAKSHYLCIKKWVIDAVKGNNKNNNNTEPKKYSQEWWDNLKIGGDDNNE